MKWKLAVAASALVSLCLQASAADAPSCRNVRFADVGWSDIAATTGMASVVLEGMGYTPSVTFASIPVALSGLKNKQIDVFLGYWNPTMTQLVEPFVQAGQIKVLEQPNLVGAKYSLAVPQYLYDKGLKSFDDIARFQKELQGKIYGIEPGNDGNALIQGMIRDNKFGLQNFQLVESSEAGMLMQAQAALRNRKAIVFLGWEPHPMNMQMKMRYLAGGDEVFGPNLGEARVYTAMPPGYEARCPNVATFLKNLQFSTDMENHVMGPILEKVKPNVAARGFLKRNPVLVEPWLRGVTTFDGQEAAPEVRAFLKRPS
jgi:glycine betaine/proline transport system substrate-binding protein